MCGRAVAALKARLDTFELRHTVGPGGISFHRDYNKRTCPGAAITEAFVLDTLRAAWEGFTGVAQSAPVENSFQEQVAGDLGSADASLESGYSGSRVYIGAGGFSSVAGQVSVDSSTAQHSGDIMGSAAS
ncbi:MAG TPA: hypothetical protein VLA19_31840 [Herpetosiphonaceae bacterium]|nr:hypothetical protein [Herpetosiphonaceae bacterium]